MLEEEIIDNSLLIQRSQPSWCMRLYYWCFEETYDSNISWMERTKFRQLIYKVCCSFIVLLVLILYVISPLNYVIGLLGQLMMFNGKIQNLNYWFNCLQASIFGYMLLIGSFIIIVFLFLMITCLIKWIKYCYHLKDPEEIRYLKNPRDDMII
jgi:hypothetical protein